MVHVRARQRAAARREDFAPLAAMLARAFYDDPVTAWFYPNAARRLRHAPGASSRSACASSPTRS